jgi:sugar phosphate isomerase/epimerase
MSSNRLLLGYSVSALPDHRLDDAVTLLDEIGYEVIGLRLHRRDLDSVRVAAMSQRLQRLTRLVPDKTWILETDGRYLLRVDQADQPSLLDSDPDEQKRRERLIARTIQAAGDIGAIVTVTSGVRPPQEDPDRLLDRLAESLRRLTALAKRCRVKLALRPATGNLISRVAHFERLLQWLPDDPLYLAADVPAMVRGGELPVAGLLGRDPARLACVFVADVGDVDGLDLPPGTGHLHWPALLAGIRAAGWSGPVCVRCHSHVEPAVETAKQVFTLLSNLR